MPATSTIAQGSFQTIATNTAQAFLNEWTVSAASQDYVLKRRAPDQVGSECSPLGEAALVVDLSRKMKFDFL